MSRSRPIPWPVLLLAAVAFLRVAWVVLLDDRPHWGNAEASDLERMVLYDQGRRGFREWSWIGQMWRDGFKPPLWFGGVPVLLAPLGGLRWSSVGLLQGALLGAAALGAARSAALAAPVGSERSAGLGAALLLASWPGAVGLSTMAGVEPLFAALLAWLPAVLHGLRASEGRRLLPFTLLLGTGLLAKWNFAAYALPAIGVAAFSLPPGARIRLGLGCVVATAPLLLWLLGPADLRLLLRGAGDEPSFDPPWGRDALLWLPRAVGRDLGAFALPALVLALPGLWFHRRSLATPALALLGLLLLHGLIPHKEVRYLLPALPLLAILVGVGLSRLPRGAVAAALAVAAGGWLDPGDPPGDRYEAPAIHVRPTRDAYGADSVFDHPTLGHWARSVVTVSLRDDPERAPLRTAIRWELHARGSRPAVMRGDHDRATDRACAFDLERSTHALTNRVLDDDEEAALRSLGYQPLAPIALRWEGLAEGAQDFVWWEREAL